MKKERNALLVLSGLTLCAFAVFSPLSQAKKKEKKLNFKPEFKLCWQPYTSHPDCMVLYRADRGKKFLEIRGQRIKRALPLRKKVGGKKLKTLAQLHRLARKKEMKKKKKKRQMASTFCKRQFSILRYTNKRTFTYCYNSLSNKMKKRFNRL